MKIIFFTHPLFLGSQSMPRYARMLAEAMKARGHEIEIWFPDPFFFTHKAPFTIRKWLGYIDQYVLFPVKVKRRLRKVQEKTLFVFTDHALGPWVPIVKKYPHVIHCHDFLAQRSALGLIPEHTTGVTGKIYQAYIKRGYRQGKNFISASKKTERDLLELLQRKPVLSEVVYNGFNQKFIQLDPAMAGKIFENKINVDLSEGFILHVGGNQWYKNRTGIIEIYNALRTSFNLRIPLLLIGQQPSAALQDLYDRSPFKESIFFLTGIDDETVRQAYAAATVLLFPSFAEGFGWPVAEAMASGCPVITTNEAPMTEVAGGCSFLIPRRPIDAEQTQEWARNAADIVVKVLTLQPHERQEYINRGLVNIKRFSPEVIHDQIEKIYKTVYLNNKSGEAITHNC